MSDLELVSVNITSENLSIDSEYQLFRVVKNTCFENKIKRSVYNKRKRRLFEHIEMVRKKMISFLNDSENIFIVDSLLLKICKKEVNAQIFAKDVDYAIPYKGYCASQS